MNRPQPLYPLPLIPRLSAPSTVPIADGVFRIAHAFTWLLALMLQGTATAAIYWTIVPATDSDALDASQAAGAGPGAG